MANYTITNIAFHLDGANNVSASTHSGTFDGKKIKLTNLVLTNFGPNLDMKNMDWVVTAFAATAAPPSPQLPPNFVKKMKCTAHGAGKKTAEFEKK